MSIKRASKLHEAIINNKYFNKVALRNLIKCLTTQENCRTIRDDSLLSLQAKNMVGNMENIGYTNKGLECIYNIKNYGRKSNNYSFRADAAA